jgi:hypothetical protein
LRRETKRGWIGEWGKRGRSVDDTNEEEEERETRKKESICHSYYMAHVNTGVCVRERQRERWEK